MSAAATSCPNCASELPGAARFCPACGAAVVGETARFESAEPAPSAGLEQPHFFGLITPRGALVLALAGLALTILAFSSGHLVLGFAALALDLLAFALFGEAARRRPQGRLASATALCLIRLREQTGFVTGSAGALSQAGRELVRLQLELRRLARARSQAQYELGDAAFAEDAARVALLRARMRELDERARACVERMQAASEQARRRVVRERLAVQPTQVAPPVGTADRGWSAKGGHPARP